MAMESSVSKAVRQGLIYSSLTAVALGTTSFTVAAEENEEVERIEVTGSRIKRTDLEGASPVTLITTEDFAKTGALSAADVLRQSNLNTFGSFSESSGSTWQSQSNINLRGAGADRTLVLINGKRMPGSPTMGGSAVNLNTIPTAAIDRIEVLTDGASAVYGSDAVAGVVNIIMKRGYEGLEISATGSSPEQDGGDEWKAHVVGGIAGDKGSVSFSVEHQDRDIIYQRDRWFSSSTGLDEQFYNDTTGVSAYARNFLDMTTFAFSPMEACNNDKMVGGGHVYDYGDGDYICGYDYTAEGADHAAREYTAGYINGEYFITDEITFNTQALFSRNETFGRYAPAAGWFNVDADQIEIQNWVDGVNTGSSTNENAGRVYYRFTDVGTRDSTTIDYSTDIQFALEGEHDDFGWDLTYHFNRAENSNYGSGYVHRPTVEALVESGEFNFGPEGNDESVVAAISHDVLAQDFMDFHSINFGINFEAIELPAGMVGWYVGTEWADYSYSSEVDQESANGEVIGSSGNGSGGDRDVWAIFAESVVPVTDDLELNFALRYDDYSDFGDNVAPKVGLRYQALEDVVIRASWGQGFRAPALSDLYAADSFSADYATDYRYCELQGTSANDCTESQYDVTRTANEDLDAEESDFYNLGVIWNITDEFSAKVEYYNLSIDNVITFISLDSLLTEEANVGYGNLSNGAEIVRAGDDPNGRLLEATTPLVNGNGFDTDGVDINLNYTGFETEIGEFGTNLDVTWVLSYEDEEYFDGPTNDMVGRNGLPEYRATWTIDWEMGSHSASILTQYIDSQSEDTDPVTYEESGKINSHTTFDVTYNYQTNWEGTVSLAVRNLTDEDPELDSNLSYNTDLYNLYGRTYLVTYTQRF
ncbi:TonB-dependent receptor [Ferrimonas lipolytica]|uniref:TonB-dependent receptor n=1 Tax=Ferrimonas lipolytica TaxID=2724191 RepID=A0A6H1UFF4_9GAMM|nr:TonB-dependent receptor [Ferrimonas lipolytica]QIZ76946.1 TonB-dependent receptor [Ferrimonas lipolytica]